MSDIAIRIENLGKQYRLGEFYRHRYSTLRESIQAAVRAPWRRLFGRNGAGPEARDVEPPLEEDTIWALRDVSFEVPRGTVLGIIGRNGAGKSTLLKILSRITEPTTGRVEIHGRVGSLLEVGTGFHPELTGRENIFVNGSILGMSRREIKSKFDEIVEFAGVQKFIDTPVKRYSSGMQVRLAFAVAAYLEPEILVVDEVLAVGDFQFQRKCLGKMQDVAGAGRTVLFVSHNLAAVEVLCSRCLLLEAGKLLSKGDPRDVIEEYRGGLQSRDLSAAIDLSNHPDRPHGILPVFQELRFLDTRGNATTGVAVGEDLLLELDVRTHTTIPNLSFAMAIYTADGYRVMTCQTKYQLRETINLAGCATVCCRLRNIRLMPGRYYVALRASRDYDLVDEIRERVPFDVYEADVYGTGRIFRNSKKGTFLPEVDWSVSRACDS